MCKGSYERDVGGFRVVLESVEGIDWGGIDMGDVLRGAEEEGR